MNECTKKDLHLHRIKFVVPGKIQGKQRPRVVRGGMHSYTPKETVQYENLIKYMYIKARNEKPEYNPNHRGTFYVALDIYKTLPKTKPKLWKELATEGNIRPTTKPDLDNILKIFLDGLNKIAWHDDSQVVSAAVRKKYTTEDEYVVVEIVQYTHPDNRWEIKENEQTKEETP